MKERITKIILLGVAVVTSLWLVAMVAEENIQNSSFQNYSTGSSGNIGPSGLNGNTGTMQSPSMRSTSGNRNGSTGRRGSTGNKGASGPTGSSGVRYAPSSSGDLHLQEPQSNPEGTPGNNGHPYQNSPPH